MSFKACFAISVALLTYAGTEEVSVSLGTHLTQAGTVTVQRLPAGAELVTVEQLKAITAEYRAKTKELKKGLAA